MPLYLMTFIFFFLQAATSRWNTFIPLPADDTRHGFLRRSCRVISARTRNTGYGHIRSGKDRNIEKRNIEKTKRARARVSEIECVDRARPPRDPRNDVSLTVTARTPVNALTRARVSPRHHEDEGGERKSGRETARKRAQRTYKQARVVVALVVMVGW